MQIKNGSFVWNDLVKETSNSIRSVNFINNSIAVTYLIDTFSEVQFYSLDGTYLKTLSMSEQGAIAGFGGDLEDTSTFFSYTNFVTPRKIYEIDLLNMSKKVFWEETLKGFNSNDYISDFTFYESKDGTKVPIHISYKKSLDINQDTPLLIYGYGGFNISILPGG